MNNLIENNNYILFENYSNEDIKKIIKTLKTGDILLCDNLEHKNLGFFGWFIKFMTYSDFSHIGMIVKNPQFTQKPLDGIYVWHSGSSNVPDADDGVTKVGVQFTPFLDFVNNYKGKIYLRRIKYHNKYGKNEEDLCDETKDLCDETKDSYNNNINNYIHFDESKTSYISYASSIYRWPITIMKKTINALNPLKIVNKFKNNNYIMNEIITDDTSINNYTNYEIKKSQQYYENIFTNEKLRKIYEIVYDKPYDLHISDWIEAYCKKDPDPQKTSRFWCSALTAFIYTKLCLFPDNLDWSIMTPSFFSSENSSLNNIFIKNIMLENEELIICNMPNNKELLH